MTNKYNLFWDGPFSQWAGSPFTNQYGTFNCAEQYMMYRKALLFDDIETADKIMRVVHPGDQKRLGRRVKNFDPKIWDAVSREIVFHGNFCKFTQNADLLIKLLETGSTIIVEASPYDTVWGIGLSADDPDAYDETKWKGKNWLGEVLTNLRNGIVDGIIPTVL